MVREVALKKDKIVLLPQVLKLMKRDLMTLVEE
jgi:hypothetical protein